AAADIPEDGIGIIDLMSMCGLIPSKGEGRRLVEQGGVSVDGEKVPSFDFKVSKDALLAGVKIKKGKKVFHKAIAE
ncbi:MAG: tyrosine--tRNA ligase, partial [Lachnospiraceae bacterium]|nr:tyrosine--tRNA ligase [Lachnospiraceae bacterium]